MPFTSISTTKPFTPDHTATPTELKKALQKARWPVLGDIELIKSAPKAEGDVFLELFKMGEDHEAIPCSVLDIDIGYKKNTLTADPHALIAHVLAHPDFVGEGQYFGVQWHDGTSYCYLILGRWDGKRGVHVGRHSGGWDGDQVFVGCRKPSVI